MDDLATWDTLAMPDGALRARMRMPLPIRGYDIDVAGIVNNQVYVRWMEDLRTAFMARWLSFEEALSRGLAPTLVRIEVDYRSALRFGEAVAGRMWTTEVGGASAQLVGEVYRLADERVAAHVRQTVCFVDLRSGRPARLPAQFRAALLGQTPAD